MGTHGLSQGVIAKPDHIVFEIDLGNPRCYSGIGVTGNTKHDGIQGVLTNGATYSPLNSGIYISDGADDWMHFGTDLIDKIKNLSEGSIEWWCKVDEATTTGYFGLWTFEQAASDDNLISCRPYNSSSTKWGLGFFVREGSGNIAWMNANGGIGSDMDKGEWYHLVYTKTPGATGLNNWNQKLFVDGVEETSFGHVNNSMDPNSYWFADMSNFDRFRLTYNRQAGSGEASMGIFRFYDIALTQQESLNNFNNQRRRYKP